MKSHYEIINNIKTIEFSDIPLELFNDFSFMSYLVSNKVIAIENYKYIPKELLKSETFLFLSINLNPDIYLICDESIKTDSLYNYLCEKHPYSYLKYASTEQLKDKEYCVQSLKKGVSNLIYFPEEFKTMDVLSGIIQKSYAFDRSTTITKEVFKAFPKNIRNDIPTINNFLVKNDFIFPYLPKKLLSDKEFCLKHCVSDTKYFEYIDKSLSQNLDFIELLFSTDKLITETPSLNGYRTRKFDSTFILNNIPLSFFTEEFCKKYSDIIIHSFDDLLPKIYSSEFVLKTFYSKENKNIGERHCELYYIKQKLNNKELLLQFKQVLSKGVNFSERRTKLINIVDFYFLRKGLTNKDSNSTMSYNKKYKI